MLRIQLLQLFASAAIFCGVVRVLSPILFAKIVLRNGSLQFSIAEALDVDSYSHLASHCSSILPISHSEFSSRQINLAKTLHSLGASAYIAEPGANTQFFGNFSKSNWFLSERPLLFIVSPAIREGEISPQITILSPKFETTRARMLPVSAPNGVVNYVEWAEDENPYAAALSTIDMTASQKSNLKIFVDDNMRKFIVDGLYQASMSGDEAQNDNTFQHPLPSLSTDPLSINLSKQSAILILSAPSQITKMREQKSRGELNILKCVNEVTLLAIREVHKNLVPGIHESYARSMMSTALGAAGLKDGGCLTLFGENAALPHGSGSDRALKESDFALFDCTASLHGYYSDVTRTVALSPHAPLSARQIEIWHHVRAAQIVALSTARNGTLTHKVDEAARRSLMHDGFEQYFTHRLGHGIGLEVHEAPYLRGGSDSVIAVGHAFSDEPGVYIEGEVGVRLEDCFFVNERGEGELLTAGVGGFSQAPWLP